jgi:hypothetical protein
MEEAINDAIDGQSEDAVLLKLIEITAASIIDESPLFDNILDEPTFYRKHFKPWVKKGIDEALKVREAVDSVSHFKASKPGG